VITVVGDTIMTIDPERNLSNSFSQMPLLARTQIGLDGHRLDILPTVSPGSATPFLELHAENVNSAVQNWNLFAATLFRVIVRTYDLTELTLPGVFKQLSLPYFQYQLLQTS
jgi:hypothetical protein